jgi:chromosome segregation ATPase
VREIEDKFNAVKKDYDALLDIHNDYKNMFKQNEQDLIKKCELLDENKVALEELQKLLLAKNFEIGEGIQKLALQSEELDSVKLHLEQIDRERQEARNECLVLQEKMEALLSESKLLELEQANIALNSGE